ncbi:MAG: leucine-rich repeat domain-containing protein, partial [Clostridia bacterium]|nr:leucine-rich repeat domain-containing protein [Clostridia bacterium]
MRKTFLAIILMAVLTVFAGCSSEGQSGDLSWSFDPDTGVLDLTGSGKMEDYKKVEVDKFKTTTTAPWADYYSDIKTVNLPEGLTRIGDYTFYKCYSLKEINFPKGLTSIGENAFFCCSSLTEITLPEGLTSIGDSAFAYCSKRGTTFPEGLTAVTLPDSLTSIGDFAFSDCAKLKEINL